MTLCTSCKVGGFFPGTPVSPTNKSDRHDIIEILLKVALNNFLCHLKERIFIFELYTQLF